MKSYETSAFDFVRAGTSCRGNADFSPRRTAPRGWWLAPVARADAQPSARTTPHPDRHHWHPGIDADRGFERCRDALAPASRPRTSRMAGCRGRGSIRWRGRGSATSPTAQCATAEPSAAAFAMPIPRQIGFLPSARWALNVIVVGANGNRRLPADQFITGAYETALSRGEMLEAIKIPRLSRRGRCGYYKVCRKAGEFALAIGVVLNDPERGQFRAVIGTTKGRPIVMDDARDLQRSDKTIDEAPSCACSTSTGSSIASPAVNSLQPSRAPTIRR